MLLVTGSRSSDARSPKSHRRDETGQKAPRATADRDVSALRTVSERLERTDAPCRWALVFFLFFPFFFRRLFEINFHCVHWGFEEFAFTIQASDAFKACLPRPDNDT